MHAKAMLRALASAIESYEEQFGEVPAIEPKPAAASPAAEPEAAILPIHRWNSTCELESAMKDKPGLASNASRWCCPPAFSRFWRGPAR